MGGQRTCDICGASVARDTPLRIVCAKCITLAHGMTILGTQFNVMAADIAEAMGGLATSSDYVDAIRAELRAAGKLPPLKKAEAEDWGYWVLHQDSTSQWRACSSQRLAVAIRAQSESEGGRAYLRGPVQRKSDPNPFAEPAPTAEQRWGVWYFGDERVGPAWVYGSSGDDVFNSRQDAERLRTAMAGSHFGYLYEVRPYTDVPQSGPSAPRGDGMVRLPGPSSRAIPDATLLARLLLETDPAVCALIDRVSEGDPKRREACVAKAIARDEGAVLTRAKAMVDAVGKVRP